MKLVVTVVGVDRVGIIAGVSTVLANYGVNIMSINQSILDGVRVETETGWFVARPSGTEDLYKIYGESYKGDKGLIALLTAGEEIVTSALSDEV